MDVPLQTLEALVESRLEGPGAKADFEGSGGLYMSTHPGSLTQTSGLGAPRTIRC